MFLTILKGPLLSYFEECQQLEPVVRGDKLARNAAIHSIHAKFAEEGDTEQKDVGETAAHYICFTRTSAGELVELDGMLQGPIGHGEVSQDNFLKVMFLPVHF
jgi:hypothetical protein